MFYAKAHYIGEDCRKNVRNSDLVSNRSVKANGAWPKSCFGRVFKLKLGRFVVKHLLHEAYTREY
jgi:hypothetical protein